MKAMQVLVLAVAVAWSGAQAADEPVKTDPKKAEAKKSEPKKQDSAKADAAKAPPKAADPKKAPAKAADPKKAPPKKAADTPKKTAEPSKKAPAPLATTTDPNVKVYKAGDPNAPKVRDKDGKEIPTNADAYDISSALKK